jgi:hypothetical protein
MRNSLLVLVLLLGVLIPACEQKPEPFPASEIPKSYFHNLYVDTVLYRDGTKLYSASSAATLNNKITVPLIVATDSARVNGTTILVGNVTLGAGLTLPAGVAKRVDSLSAVHADTLAIWVGGKAYVLPKRP